MRRRTFLKSLALAPALALPVMVGISATAHDRRLAEENQRASAELDRIFAEHLERMFPKAPPFRKVYTAEDIEAVSIRATQIAADTITTED